MFNNEFKSFLSRSVCRVLCLFLIPIFTLSAAEFPLQGRARTNHKYTPKPPSSEEIQTPPSGSENEETSYHIVELSNHVPLNASIRSFFIPGWGQGFNNQKGKGFLIFIAFAATTVGTISIHRKSMNSYDGYTASGLKDNSSYDDYNRQRTEALLLGSVATGLWVWSIIDATRNAYSPLWSKKSNIELALSPEGAGLLYKRRF